MSRTVRSIALSVCAGLLLGAAGARAAVTQAAPDGFLLTISSEIAAPPATVFGALVQPANWWSSRHTWSGDAKNLNLELEPGGCYCERWPGGGVEHARVVFVKKDEALRLNGALGPLQEMGATGILNFALKPSEKGTVLTVTYRLSGDSSHGLDKIAPFVDKVVVEQVERLKRLVETGKSDERTP